MDLLIMRKFLRCAGLALLMSWSVAMQAQKVEVCHTPPSDPDNVHTIEVERNGLRDHLGHGDYLGPCKEDEENYFSINVAPNPYYERTNINYSLYEPATIQMVVYDQIGKRVKVLVDADLEPGKYSHEFSTLDYGISHGVYFLKVMRKTADKEFLHFERLVDLH
jgi:hypothetical protein